MWLSVLAVAIGAPLTRAAEDTAQPVVATDYWTADERSAVDWAMGSLSLDEWEGLAEVESPPVEGSITDDPALEPAQMQSPQFSPRSTRQPVALSPSTRRSAPRAAASSTLASVPYMIGDTGAGSCIGFSGLVSADLSHPTLACSRLNVSEANSPLPTDRFYYSYRHFDDATTISAYQFSDTLNIDQHTLAWENSFWHRTGSLEIRVPIEQRMRSDIFSIIAPNFGVVDLLVAPRDGRNVELGNVSMIFKILLTERENFAISGGLGVTLPTARDVSYSLAVSGEITFPDAPGIVGDQNVAFQSIFANETVYLSPFLAWGYSSPSRWFHQGFFQVEVAANPSTVTVNGDGATDFLQNNLLIGFYDYFTPTPERVDLHAQTLMRLNLGWGYILSENRDPDRYTQWAGLFERLDVSKEVLSRLVREQPADEAYAAELKATEDVLAELDAI